MKNASTTIKNIFFFIGIVAIVLMVWSIGFDEIVDNVSKTGWWFFVIIGMWVPVFMINTLAFNMIIRDDDPNSKSLSFLHVLKINISGFAVRSATPLGFLGGDPYKIMEFKSVFGMEKATSSVLLYTMTQMTAHFILWALALIAAALLLPMGLKLRIIFLSSFVVFLVLLFLLWRGYKKGLTVKLFDILAKVPFLKRWVVPFCKKYNGKLIKIDLQISHLYNKRRKVFLSALTLEFIARLCNCLEVYFILLSVNIDVTVFQSLVIYGFMSLFANILFFSPMQVGTREGGFILALKALAMNGGLGIYISLVTRVRELFWLGVGILLMKVKGKTVKPLAIDEG